MKFRFSFSKKFLIACVGLLVGIVSAVHQTQAQSSDCNTCSNPGDDLECNKQKQACWEDKIDETQAQAQTLKNTIAVLNGQIELQQLQINQTLAEINQLEEEIVELDQRIEGLGFSLDRLGVVLIERIRAEYKQGRSSSALELLGSDTLSGLITKMKYLLLAQRQTAEAMERTETQRLEYDEQKTLKEEKQAQLEAKRQTLQTQRATLDQQKADQQFLLSQTQANEAVYQAELAKTLAELSAIQSIIAGQGSESEVKDVNQGDGIASIIAGPSACSTGAHLHFEVVKDGYHRDPASYLKSTSIIWSNSPDGSFSIYGGWEWPLNDPARITQGYGMTYYARAGYYGGAPHTGIDMISKSSGNYAVKAVRKGMLYRGSISCGGGLLRYVRVDHSEDSEDTFYLHVNY